MQNNKLSPTECPRCGAKIDAGETVCECGADFGHRKFSWTQKKKRQEKWPTLNTRGIHASDIPSDGVRQNMDHLFEAKGLWSSSRASAELGICRTSFSKICKEAGIAPARFGAISLPGHNRALYYRPDQIMQIKNNLHLYIRTNHGNRRHHKSAKGI